VDGFLITDPELEDPRFPLLEGVGLPVVTGGAARGHELEQQRIFRRRKHALDAGEKRTKKESTSSSSASRASTRPIVRVRAAVCARRSTRAPAKLLGGVEDAGPPLLADAGPAVDGKRHRGGRRRRRSSDAGDGNSRQ
jgi:hypothetical protein